MKKILVILFCLFFSQIGTAFSLELSWFYVQHREYANGKSVNRLGFGLTDEKGQSITDDNIVKSVTLFDPYGNVVNLPPSEFYIDEEIYGYYDGKNSQWNYRDEWQVVSWFRADFSEPLIPGIYRLIIETQDGRESELTYKFNKLIRLPILSSSSIRLNTDSFGNVVWKWDIPEELGRLAFNHKTTARAAIEVFKNQKNVAFFSVKVPSHMGYIFIPRDLVQSINKKGDKFGLKIQLEAKDNNYRTYSDVLMINDLKSIRKE
ncbi:hypothetical protein ACFL1Z_04610 [Thermodesulfobacteriota bacterium]